MVAADGFVVTETGPGGDMLDDPAVSYRTIAPAQSSRELHGLTLPNSGC